MRISNYTLKIFPVFVFLFFSLLVTSCVSPEIIVKYDKTFKSSQPRIMTEKNMNLWEMVLIPAGDFKMGSTEGLDDEIPQFNVYTDNFYIDKYEVTCYQYMVFCEVTGHPKPQNWPGGNLPLSKYFEPVRYVSFHDAEDYAQWLGKTIPTEQQWEKAARGFDGRLYPWGDDWLDDAARTIEDKFSLPQYVGWHGDFSASPYGVLDMAGNVFEWTSTWYNAYPNSSATSEFFGSIVKVIRGGSFENSKELASTTYRGIAYPDIVYSNIGFRCVYVPQNREELPPTILILPDGTVQW